MKPKHIFASWIISWEYIDGFANYDLDGILKYDCTRVAVRGETYYDWTLYVQPPYDASIVQYIPSERGPRVRTRWRTASAGNKTWSDMALEILKAQDIVLDDEAALLFRT